MRNKIFLLSIFVSLLASHTFASINEQTARQATSDNLTESETAIASLRLAGKRGLDELFAVYGKEIEQFRETGARTGSWNRISNAIDRVAMQKDAYASQLFWFTNLEEAKSFAKQTRKPILSLRLLGNLNEEFSCANSRFFRSILYSNSEISRTVRENYVLHWKSVRPAPRVTVDYGDGRKIERTITGNSIHYVLDENGKILDGLPGLYSPQEFSKYLTLLANLHRSVEKQPEQLEVFRQLRRDQLLNKWRSDLVTIGVKMPESEEPVVSAESLRTSPTALRAAPLAVTKMAVELPIVAKFTLDEESLLSSKTDLDGWKKLSDLFGKPDFDRATKNFIRLQTSPNEDLNSGKFTQMLAVLKNYVAIDTVRNEYLFHTKIYKMLLENPSDDIEKFNDAVYSGLFLTPNSDPWLGLYSPEIYSALDGNGITR